MRVVLVTALLLTLGACAVTPQGRIERYPDLVAQVPPDQLERVKAGEIAVGFSPAAVVLAVGQPDRKVERSSPEGSSEVWYYYRAVPVAGYDPCFYARFGCNGFLYAQPFYGPFWNGPFFGQGFYGIGGPGAQEYLRVTFQGGRVHDIERER